jgi:hypothetical protein
MAEQSQELDLTQLSVQQLDGLKKSLEKVRALGTRVGSAVAAAVRLSKCARRPAPRAPTFGCRPCPRRDPPRRTWRR